MSTAIELAALARALALHRIRIAPAVLRLQEGWAEAAAALPDPGRRQAALAALREKGRNAEGTAAFALLAPRRTRPGALAAMAALQTAIDYLDSLDEAEGGGVERGMALHAKLLAAVPGGAAEGDPRAAGDDHLDALASFCRAHLAALPALEAVEPHLREAIRRCGEGQSRTHAAAPVAAADVEGLRGWAEALPGAPPGYLWWELAAGASSSVAAHALIAAAADPRTTAAEAGLIDTAYFPPVGALTVLLDDLVDREADAAAGEHSYLAYCPDPALAASRIGLLADRAAAAIAPLRRRATHAAILAGVAGFYLADRRAGSSAGTLVRDRLLASLGLPARLVIAARSAG